MMALLERLHPQAFNLGLLLSAIGYLLTLTLLPIVLLTPKRQPVSTVAWLMTIVMMPYVGAVLFLVFGINRVSRRVRDKLAASANLARAFPPLAEEHRLAVAGLSPRRKTLWQLAERLAGAPATVGNELIVLSDTKQAFAEIEQALSQAQHTIHLEYYIWQPDRIGTRLRDLLIERAKTGVRVRFLYDNLGSLHLTHEFFAPMLAAGIQVAAAVPGRSLRERWSINLRNHRKIIVVDSRIGFTGGMNVGDEYLGMSQHFGFWRDTHLRLVGPAVSQLEEVFLLDWSYAFGDAVPPTGVIVPPENPGTVAAQVIASGPDDEQSAFHALNFAAINSAERTLELATSYFVPPPALVTALEAAALRGVQVRILLAGPVTYWYTYHAARSYFDSLLEAGVEIYEYQRGQQHSKVLTVDDDWSMVGTPNFDFRSMFLNFEVAVIAYDTPTTTELSRHFNAALNDAARIDPAVWAQRSAWTRLRENYCRLFAHIL